MLFPLTRGVTFSSLAPFASRFQHTLLRHTRLRPSPTNYRPFSALLSAGILYCDCSTLGPRCIQPKSPFHLSQKPSVMSSDEAYSSFLDQANQDTGANKASTQSKSKSASTKAVDTEVPAALQKVEQYYTSEADEPFEPVSLKWTGKNMPSESM